MNKIQEHVRPTKKEELEVMLSYARLAVGEGRYVNNSGFVELRPDDCFASRDQYFQIAIKDITMVEVKWVGSLYVDVIVHKGVAGKAIGQFTPQCIELVDRSGIRVDCV